MKPSNSSDADRLLELLADQTLVGLDADQQRELESLMQAKPDVDIAALARTAAMLDIAASAGDLEPLPDHLRDRVLMQEQSEFGPIRTLSDAAQPRNKIHWREAVAWLTAAACLLVATMLWFTRPATNQNSPKIVEAEPPTEKTVVERRQTAAVVSMIAQQREQLLASAPDVMHLRLVNSDNGAVAREPGGDVVWSSGQQMGYLRLQGLAKDGPAQRQYQLWIIEGDASSNEFINGGTFFVNRSTGELTVPIQADHFVQMPKMFLIRVEPLGGGDALATSLLAKADGLRP